MTRPAVGLAASLAERRESIARQKWAGRLLGMGGLAGVVYLPPSLNTVVLIGAVAMVIGIALMAVADWRGATLETDELDARLAAILDDYRRGCAR